MWKALEAREVWRKWKQQDGWDGEDKRRGTLGSSIVHLRENFTVLQTNRDLVPLKTLAVCI